jgi:hypothetical protein
MQFCHAHRNLWQNRSFLATFPANASHVLNYRYLLQIRARIRPEAPLAGLFSLATPALVDESSTHPAWQTQQISLDGVVEKRGKCATSDFWPWHGRQNILIHILVSAFIFQPFSLAVRGCPLSVDLVYDPATLDQGTTNAGS